VRLVLLALLLVCGAALIAALYVSRVRSPLQSTLASSFQLLGTPVKLVDRVASRMVPVNALDERDLGDTYRRRYDAQAVAGGADQEYLDALVKAMSPFLRKPFPYRAYVIGSWGAPNAMALPGGVILVTRELLTSLQSESELVAVLAHELGHIEQGHCFDAVRFQLLSRKIGSDTLGALADAAARMMLRHAYSKTTEDEADKYAYELVVNSRYDPMGVGGSFGSLRQYPGRPSQTPQHADPIRDYFMSHPPLEIREAEFSERAAAWWKQHAEETRYVGRQNLVERKALGTLDLSGEWVSGSARRVDRASKWAGR
jgi:beta-barrel assembly-enhancing protease